MCKNAWREHLGEQEEQRHVEPEERFTGLQPPLLVDDAQEVVVVVAAAAAAAAAMMIMMIGCEMSMLYRRGGGKC